MLIRTNHLVIKDKRLIDWKLITLYRLGTVPCGGAGERKAIVCGIALNKPSLFRAGIVCMYNRAACLQTRRH
jgi:hypothetical protein